MYKPTEPIRCPKCGAIVNVNTSMILTSNPPCYEWTCPKCGEKGCTKQGDIITFENQTLIRTLPYIQKVGEPDLGVGATTTNADDIKTIDITPAIYSTNTKCIICGEEFGFDGEHRICPKCREAIVKLRKTADSTANTMPTDKSTANAVALENKVFIEATTPPPKTRSCDIPAPQFIQQGWECPKCGAVLAPNQSYCPFCSPSEYGRSNWVVTTPVRVPLEQYTNPNPSTTISLGVKPKKSGSCTATFATPSDNIKATL